MAVPENINDQLKAATALIETVKAAMRDGPHLDRDEIALNAVMDGFRRLIAVEVFDIDDAGDRASAMAHIAANMGRFIGEALHPLPSAAQQAAMKIFADQLNAAMGAPKAVVIVATGDDQPSTPEERLH